jgi:hypothetical protein
MEVRINHDRVICLQGPKQNQSVSTLISMSTPPLHAHTTDVPLAVPPWIQTSESLCRYQAVLSWGKSNKMRWSHCKKRTKLGCHRMHSSIVNGRRGGGTCTLWQLQRSQLLKFCESREGKHLLVASAKNKTRKDNAS